MDPKTIFSMLAGGISHAGAYLLGVLMQLPPTESLNNAMGSVGWTITGVMFAAGAFGLNMAIKTQPPGGVK